MYPRLNWPKIGKNWEFSPKSQKIEVSESFLIVSESTDAQRSSKSISRRPMGSKALSEKLQQKIRDVFVHDQIPLKS